MGNALEWAYRGDDGYRGAIATIIYHEINNITVPTGPIHVGYREEIIQEAIIQCLHVIDTRKVDPSRPDTIKGFLYISAVRKALKTLKRFTKIKHHEVQAERDYSVTVVEDDEIQILKGMQINDPTVQALIDLSRSSDKTMQTGLISELAQKLGISRQTMWKRLCRFRQENQTAYNKAKQIG